MDQTSTKQIIQGQYCQYLFCLFILVNDYYYRKNVLDKVISNVIIYTNLYNTCFPMNHNS